MKKIVGYTLAATLLMPNAAVFANTHTEKTQQISLMNNTVAATTTNVASDMNELQGLILSRIENYETQFTLSLQTSTSFTNKDTLETAIKDYLQNLRLTESTSYIGYLTKKSNLSIITNATNDKATITFNIEYYTTQQQETYMKTEAEKIAKSIFTVGMTDFEKVKAVNDYIVKNTAFTPQASTSPYAPYTILNQKKGVSQAYALLTYRLLKLKVVTDGTGTKVVDDAGFDVRMVEGTVKNGIPHVWNQVEVDGKLYHLDTAWNDSYPDVVGEVKYNYFLMNDATMQNTHSWDISKYTDTALDTAYLPFGDAYQPVKIGNYYYFTRESEDYEKLYKFDPTTPTLSLPVVSLGDHHVKALAYDPTNKILYFSSASSGNYLYMVYVNDAGELETANTYLILRDQIKSLSVDIASKILKYTKVNGSTGSLSLKTKDQYDQEAITPVVNTIKSLITSTTVNLDRYAYVDAMMHGILSDSRKNKISSDYSTEYTTYTNLKNNFTTDQTVISNIYKINDLDSNYRNQVIIARTAYDGLTDNKKLVTNVNLLTTAESNINTNLSMALSLDTALVKIQTMIEKETNKTDTSFYTAVQQARTTYDALTLAQKALVLKYDVLLDAEALVKADRQAAFTFDYRMLFVDEANSNFITSVENLRTYYDSLTKNQKSLVTSYSQLPTYEKKVTELKKVPTKLVADIAAIKDGETGYVRAIIQARKTYNSLTDAQKAVVTNYSILEGLEATANYLSYVAGAQQVINLIASLSESSSTLETDLKAAQDAYDALGSFVKEAVSNIDRLEDLKSWLPFKTVIQNVINLISKISSSSASYESDVSRARAAYDQLTKYQKSKVTNYSVLTAAEKAIAAKEDEDIEIPENITYSNGIYTAKADVTEDGYEFSIPAEVVRKTLASDGQKDLVLKTTDGITITMPANSVPSRMAKHGDITFSVEVESDTAFSVKATLQTTEKTEDITDLLEYTTISIPLSLIQNDLYAGEYTIFRMVDDETVAATPFVVKDDVVDIKTRTLGDFLVSTDQFTFYDIEDSGYQEDIEFLANRRIVNGTTEFTYSPFTKVTRAQFSVMLARALDLKATEPTGFYDVEGRWYADAVQALKEQGIVNGVTTEKFNPENYLTRQQAAIMMMRVLDLLHYDFDSIEDTSTRFRDENLFSDEGYDAIYTLQRLGVISGKDNGRFDPNDYLTRGQMAKILHKVLEVSGMY